MRAKYTGFCPTCSTSIYVGEEIKKHKGRWNHAGCIQGSLAKHEYDASEYAKGRAMGQHLKETRDMFGEEAAFLEEMEWERRDPDPAY